MPPLLQALKTHDATRDAFNGWMRAGILTTDFSTEQGVTRNLSQLNALEVGFQAALMRAGMDVKLRGEVVARWLKQVEGDSLPEVVLLDRLAPHRCAAAPAEATIAAQLERFSKPRSGFVDKDAPASIGESGRDAPTELVLINLTEIVRRTDALFAEQA